MTIADLVDSQTREGSPRVLIVGAGIAGSTLGALLKQSGLQAALLERGDADEPGGYMLGLMPWGGRVLDELGLTQTYRENSVDMSYYAMFGRKGQFIRRYPLAPLTGESGAWRGIERQRLLDILRAEAGTIEYGSTVVDLEDGPNGISVTYIDGSESTLDLVVAADGIHSTTRSLIFPDKATTEFDTGWGGFVLWSSYTDEPPHTYSEMWSDGWGIGIYPVPGRTGLFLAGRQQSLRDRDPMAYAEELASRSLPAPFSNALDQLDRSEGGVYWPMKDVRAESWRRGHCVLLGDAATAFLPTAGVGASAAMNSAAVLADCLADAGPQDIHAVLDSYERRQRSHVELAQKSSQNLARYMFVNSPLAAWGRDQLMRLYTPSMMFRSLTRVMSER